MLGFLKNILDDNAREIKKLQRVVNETNGREAQLQGLSDAELQGKTAYFKDLLASGTTLDDILPEAFAVVREASRRVLGMRHFDVQLLGGAVLHQGKIAEMKTGEGKTLVATLPAYLNALTGRGVHIVTVNDYLARRDSEWMGQIYRFLGLSVGLIVHGLNHDQRKEAYGSDITYGTNNEFGFDYLRGNMAVNPEEVVQRDLHYCIVDEVDSILIDEARTPLIISGQANKPTDLYYTMARLIPRLKNEDHYTVDEKARTVALTEEGEDKVEEMLKIDNLSDDKNIELRHYVNQALRAHALMKRDRDYVVKDGKVIIVDEFTGRLMFGRRYSDGLHQSIEAKEGVEIERESQTLATITFQNYFRMYEKLAGMTGTADTEAEEFKKIYKLDVVVVPTHRPMVRQDMADVIFKNEPAKFTAVVEEISARHATGQPVLVGTISIEKSEVLSKMLKRRGVPHQVLNAKFHEQEAQIVAQAGRLGAVTIATNMAGRGTDIILGGNPSYMAKEKMREQGYPDEILAEVEEWGACGEEVAAARRVYRELLEECKRITDADHDRVVALGGLYIVGTERHESRRIDNQLRGRCGRQGDPGAAQFFVALDDDLLRLFGGENIAGIMNKLKIEDDVPLEHPLISRSLESAQRRVENRNFSIRKHVLEYDDVINQQRELIYSQRRQVLLGEDLRPVIREMMDQVVENGVNSFASDGVYPEDWNLAGLIDYFGQVFLPAGAVTPEDIEGLSRKELQDFFAEKMDEAYAAREAELGTENLRQIERIVMLKIVDDKWMDHLDAMDQLREGIGLRAYGQKDPLIEYKFESYEMFQNMIASIQEDVVRYLFRVRMAVEPERRKTTENLVQEGPRRPVRREVKVGRNDPCPCGSGKKYKKCCGREKAKVGTA
ncbi:MAG: preprotein translocase subunit SecA [Clostridia bacterium]|nr:preprotein translocase subunit SecA [Clostridia bacterium]